MGLPALFDYIAGRQCLTCLFDLGALGQEKTWELSTTDGTEGSSVSTSPVHLVRAARSRAAEGLQ